MTAEACNSCDRRDCPAISHDQLSPAEKEKLMERLLVISEGRVGAFHGFSLGEVVKTAFEVIRALDRCRTNLREDLEVIHESIVALMDDGSAPPPMCGWCGTSFSHYDAIRDHLLTCAKHPLVILAEKRATTLRALRDVLADEARYEPYTGIVVKSNEKPDLLAQIDDALAPVQVADGSLVQDHPTIG